MLLLFTGCFPPALVDPDPLATASGSEPFPSVALADCPAGAVVVRGERFDGLQPALDAARAGDVVGVCAGTYTGSFRVAVPVVLGGVGQVVLDGDGAGPVLAIPAGSWVLDLVLTGGRAESGGGLVMTSGGELAVARCTIADNQAEEGGGIWLAPGSTASIVDSEISGNVARAGGGLWLEDAELHATGSVITDNIAEDGGGVYADGSSIVGGSWSGNAAAGYGGGAVLIGSDAVGMQVRDNEATFGGGLYAMASEIRGSVVERNGGDGIYAVAGVTLTDTWVREHAVGVTVAIDRVDVVRGAIVGNPIGAESDGGLGQILSSVDGTDWGAVDPDGAIDVVWGLRGFSFGSGATFTCVGLLCGP